VPWYFYPYKFPLHPLSNAFEFPISCLSDGLYFPHAFP